MPEQWQSQPDLCNCDRDLESFAEPRVRRSSHDTSRWLKPANDLPCRPPIAGGTGDRLTLPTESERSLLLQRFHVVQQRFRLIRRDALRLVGRHVWRLLRLLSLQDNLHVFIVRLGRVEFLLSLLAMTHDALAVLIVRGRVRVFHVALSSASYQKNQCQHSHNCSRDDNIP